MLRSTPGQLTQIIEKRNRFLLAEAIHRNLSDK